MSIQPFAGTATRRRELRQSVRNALGVSHQSAPTLRQLSRAITALSELVVLTTGGKYQLRVLRLDGTPVEQVWTEWKED